MTACDNAERPSDGPALDRQRVAVPPMRVVSVTRFRLRSLRFLPFFMFHANRTIAQIRKSDGFVAGAVRREGRLAYWTMTVWRDEPAMRAYAASGAHRKAIPHLAEWADEARIAHWPQPGGQPPEWPEVIRRLREDGRPLAVRHPAPSHFAPAVAEPQMTRGMQL